MTGQPNLWGEIKEDEIIKIARKAAEKRGYAIYADYNEYMRPKICQGKLEPVRAGWFLYEIRATLVADEWIHSSGHPEARFYPSGTPPPTDDTIGLIVARLGKLEGLHCGWRY